MFLNELITTKNDSLDVNSKLKDVLLLMSRDHIHHVILLQGSKPVAIITERDILFLYSKNMNLDINAYEIATKPVITIFEDRPANYVLNIMIDHNIRRVVVTNLKGEYVGTILQEDIIYELEKTIHYSQLKISEILKPSNKVIFVNYNTSLQDALDTMTAHYTGSILVYKDKKPVGIITESDIVQLANSLTNRSKNVEYFMHSPIVMVDEKTYIPEAIKTMKSKSIRRIVTKDIYENYYIITSTDILKNLQGNYSLMLESKLKDSRETLSHVKQPIIELYDLGSEQIVHWFNEKSKEVFNISVGDPISIFIDKSKWEKAYDRCKQNDKFINLEITINNKVVDIGILSRTILGSTIIKLIFNFRTDSSIQNTTYKYDKNYQTIIESLTDSHMLFNIDKNGKFTYISQSVESILGFTQAEFLANHNDIILNNDITTSIFEQVQNRDIKTFKIRAKDINSDTRHIKISYRPIIENDDIVSFQGIAEDITVRWRNKILLNGKTRVLELLAKGANQKDILDEIVYYIEELNPDIIASILILNKNTLTLHEGASPSLPEFYNNAMEGLSIGDGIGSCGTAAFRKSLVIVEDILEHPYWFTFKDIVEKTSLRACWSHPIIGLDGDVLGTFGIYYKYKKAPNGEELDIIRSAAELTAIALERIKAQTTLVEMEAKERMLLDSSTNGIFGLDLNGVSTFVNPSAAKMLGFNSSELLNIKLHAVVHHSHIDKTPRSLKECRILAAVDGEEHHVNDEVFWRKDGTYFHVEYKSIPIKEGVKTVGIMVTFNDISLRLKYEERVAHMAFHDSLTDLPNRALFKDHLHQELSHVERHSSIFALMFLDLDHFKDINDTLGHLVGDKLLIEVASRLAALIRKSDTVARMGGDEFAIIQSELESPLEASLLAERIIEDLSKPYILEDHNMSVGCSIGIVIVDGSDMNDVSLISKADVAMYRSKELGRGRFIFFEDAMTKNVLDELNIIHNIKDALTSGEIYMVYQPQIKLSTKKICSLESLIRWESKELGFISPAVFIPIAEKRGLITEVGNWIIDEVCKQINRWLELKNDIFRVSINISSAQITDKRALENIISIIEKNRVDLKYIELEFTETMLLSIDKETQQYMKILQQRGITYAIDDFGTGYSSMSSLRQIKADKLKIDMEFIQDVLDDKDDQEIIKATIALGHALNMQIVAEGAEELDQVKILQEYGCNIIQGYYYAKPMMPEMIEFDKIFK